MSTDFDVYVTSVLGRKIDHDKLKQLAPLSTDSDLRAYDTWLFKGRSLFMNFKSKIPCHILPEIKVKVITSKGRIASVRAAVFVVYVCPPTAVRRKSSQPPSGEDLEFIKSKLAELMLDPEEPLECAAPTNASGSPRT